MCHKNISGSRGLDPHVLIDAIATCMAHEEKELCKPGQVALNVILDTAAAILGSKYRVSLVEVEIFSLLWRDFLFPHQA